MKYDNGKKIDGFVVIPKDMFYKGSKMRLSEKTQRVFSAVLANTVGYEAQKVNNESIRRTEHFLTPDYISKVTGVPVASVRRAYNELEARGVIKLSKRVREHSETVSGQVVTYKRNTTYVEINNDTDKWVEDPPAKHATHPRATQINIREYSNKAFI